MAVAFSAVELIWVSRLILQLERVQVLCLMVLPHNHILSNFEAAPKCVYAAT
jgi:hypothetical protein